MKQALYQFSQFNPVKQAAIVFLSFAVLSLALEGAKAVDPSAKGLFLSFGPAAILSVVFVSFLNFHMRKKHQK